MNIWLLLLVIALVFLVIFQIAKASEYVSALRGEKAAKHTSNRINAWLMLVFMVLGLIAAYWCNEKLKGDTLFAQGSASVEGEEYDSMFMLTLFFTGIVFVVTQILLFWFSFRYSESENRKPYYFSHNNTLEIIWTTIPAIVLTVLVVFGLKHWFKITGDPPENAMLVEITGQQFGWIYRYPGPDGVLGKKNYKLIDGAKSNSLGQDWADGANHDDLMPTNMFLVKGRPVKLVIYSKDVVHSVGLPHFRQKMDAVPGIPTTLWFTPQYTTDEMKTRTGNPDFEYEIVCDQLCGTSHYAMRGVIKVVDQETFDTEMANVKPTYFIANPGQDPTAGAGAQPATDSTAVQPTGATTPAAAATPAATATDSTLVQ